MKTRLLEIDESDKEDIVFFFRDEGNNRTKKLVASASIERLVERLANVSQPGMKSNIDLKW